MRRIKIILECDVKDKDMKTFESRLRRIETAPKMITGLPPIKIISVEVVGPPEETK
jgi:hypothetical protein